MDLRYILQVEAARFLHILHVRNEREKSRMTLMCFPLKDWSCVWVYIYTYMCLYMCLWYLEYDNEYLNVTEPILAKCTKLQMTNAGFTS